MIILLTKKATEEQIEQMSLEYGSYIKIVIDIEKEILAGGGEKHYDEEKLLLENGSKQKSLWGGGIDLQTKEIDYNSMINVRPNQDNPSRDIMSKEIRKKFDKIINNILLYK